MAKVIYLEDTITLLANSGGLELVQRLAKIGVFKETQNGYRYIVIEKENADNSKP